ncbi:MAG: twin-arginine translocase subunit TatC, partial [Legionellales bacterium]|nr:twin-arginine translocase subunit TatC [Legionellales bacterium]
MQHAIALLTEFRKRFLNVLFVFIGLFGIGFYYSNILFYIYMLPLQRLLPPPHHLIATQITTPIITPLALAINVALFCTTPYGLWQLWRFAAPALYQAERRKLRYLLTSSLGLFCLGCLFCYFFILPFMFQCMIQAL